MPERPDPSLFLQDEDPISEVVYALSYLDDALLRASGRGEQFEPLQRFVTTALFSLARRTDLTPRTLLDRLFKGMPSDEAWRHEVLPELERRTGRDRRERRDQRRGDRASPRVRRR